MATEKEISGKWNEVIGLAIEYSTTNELPNGREWLSEAFNEYLELSDNTPGYGMGGQPGSLHNRHVLAGKIRLELGNGVGGRHILSDEQSSRLRECLQDIANNPPEEDDVQEEEENEEKQPVRRGFRR